MRRPPEAPSPNLAPSERATIVGHMLLKGRLPGAIEFGRPGRGSNHMMPLFHRMPVEGSMTLEPKIESNVCVSATTTLPCASATLKCVVQEGLAARRHHPSS